MGREKRIAESRTKEILEKTKTPPAERSQVSGPSVSAVAPQPLAPPQKGAHALFNILLLFILPAILMVLVGKFIFKL